MIDTINGRTLDEIKKALQCRVKGCSEKCDHRCDMCELHVPNYRLEDRYADAHAYIRQLESRLAQVERERDAAVADILHVLHTKGTIDAECLICDMEKPDCHWECEKGKWRGVCPGNTKELSE